MVRVLHLSDIHLGSGVSHGFTNAETGLNTRFEDFVAMLERCIDRALLEPVDLVLFGGDAFPTATPPPFAQDAFAQQFRRLVDAHIPTVMLVGNHDQFAQGQGGASLCIYRALGVPDVVVGDRLSTHVINTPGGIVQVVTLPWINHSTLLTRPETEGRSIAEINELLLSRLRAALEGEIRQLDPNLPTILLAHVMVDTARFGAERFLAVGKSLTVPMALLCRPCFDYVALGHVHRHQVLCSDPPVVYPGSIERVDFSEEGEEKGFVLADVKRGTTTLEFCPLPARPFHTIRIDLSKDDDPHRALLNAIESAPIDDAVVRLIYHIRPDQLDTVRFADVQQVLGRSHMYTVHPELVSQLARPRLPELGLGQDLSPIEALKSYLEHQSGLQDLSTDLLAAAEALLADDDWLASAGAPALSQAPSVDSDTLAVSDASLNYGVPVEGASEYGASDDGASESEQAVNQLRLI
jgi:exonuclease SbcD